MWDVEVRLLGPVELRVDGLLVPLERVQVRRLLALLALRPGASQASDQLIEELWPGDLPQSPRAALRVVASRLRHALSRHSWRLRLTGDAYRLEVDDGAVDLAAFDALVAAEPVGGLSSTVTVEQIGTALTLWRGPPFGGAQGPPSLDRETTRLERTRIAAGVQQAALLMASRSFDRVVILLAPMVEEHPTDERAAVMLASALAGTGRRTDALAVLRRARQELLEGHGLDPNGQLAAAEQTILLAPEPGPVVVAAPARARARQRLHGREDVIEPLVGWLAVPAGAGARCVLIDGPAGIGKSAVALAIAERLGRRTVHVHCDPDLTDVESLTAVLEVGSNATTGDARGRTLALVDALVDRINVLIADGGAMTLVVDDLQWATEVELRFLLRAVRVRSLERLAVVATTRSSQVADNQPALRRLVGKLCEHENARRVTLGPLDGTAARSVYASWGGRPLTAPGAAALLELTGGSPYLVRAIAMSGHDPATIDSGLVTDHLSDTIAARLDQLDSATTRIVSAAAVLGRVVDLQVLAATCRADPPTVVSAIDNAVHVGLLVFTGGICRFDHELTRTHLAHAVGPATTFSLHQSASVASVEVGRDAIVVAHHVLGAGVFCADTRAVRDLLAGADLAAHLGAFDDAARFLARAAELEPEDARRLDIQCRQAWALECAGDRPATEALIDEVFADARERGWSSLMARAALAGGAFGAATGGNERRRERLAQSLDHPPDDERLRLDVVTAMILELDSADESIPEHLLILSEELAADDDTRIARLAVNLRTLRFDPASPQHVIDAMDYVAAARQTGDPPKILHAEETLAKTHVMIGDLASADRAHADLARTIRLHRWPRYVWSELLLAAVLTDLRQGPVAAEEPARRAMAVGREHGVDDAINAYGMFRLGVALRRGGLAEFEQLIRAVTQSRANLPAWHAVLAASLVDGGDHIGAAEELGTFLRVAEKRVTLFHHVGVVYAVRAACQTGDRQTLAKCVDWLLPWSGNLLLAGVGAACYGPADSVLAEALAALDDERAPAFARAGEELLVTAGATAWSLPG